MQPSSLTQLNDRTLWAGSLPPYVDESYLFRLFAHTNSLVNARVMRDKQTGVSQGFAFLEFTSRPAAQQVLSRYDGKHIHANLVLRLNWAAFGLGRSSEGVDGTELHSLFVGDIALEVTDLLLQTYFQQFFQSVNSAKVITDRSTGLSKGYGFVRFGNAAERDEALKTMDGHVVCNHPIRVSKATLKKYQADGQFYPSDMDPNNTTAFVGNVNEDVTEEDLSQVFWRCGDIRNIKLLRAKGCAFVTYTERPSAERAIKELHGKVIKNSAIRLCWGRRNTSRLPTLAQPTSNYILPLPWANPPLPTYTGEGPSLPPMYDTSAMLPLSLQMYQQAGLGPGPGPGPGPGYPAHPPHYSSQVGSSHSFAPEGQGGLQARGQAEQQSMSDALQAFAELQLNQPAMSGPYSL